MNRYNLHFFQKALLVSSICFLWVGIIFQALFRSDSLPSQWENNILFILDVSQSMNVVDSENNSRINTAKAEIISIMRSQQGTNFALNIFAWESLRVLPFTTDIWLLSTFLLWLDSRNVSKQGSDIESALALWLESFDEQQSWKIVLLSDGSDEEVDIDQKIISQFREKNIALILVWVGSQEGWYIPSNNSLNPYKMYQGRRVISSLNSEDLQNIARTFDGEYFDIDDFTEQESLWQTSNNSRFPYIYVLFIISWIWYLLCSYYIVFDKSYSYDA